MKYLIIALMVTIISSCSVRGPYTGTEYSIGANQEDGIYLKAMPLRWQSIVKTKNEILKWSDEGAERVGKEQLKDNSSL